MQDLNHRYVAIRDLGDADEEDFEGDEITTLAFSLKSVCMFAVDFNDVSVLYAALRPLSESQAWVESDRGYFALADLIKD